MAREYVGDYSKASIRSLEYANAIQGLAVASIQKLFNSFDDSLNVAEGFSLADLIKARVDSTKAGTREEFEAELAAQIAPIIDAVFMAQEQSTEGQPNG